MNEHDDLLKRLNSLNEDVPPMPEGFHEGWVSRLEDGMETKETKKRRFTKQNLIRVLAVAAALVFVVGGATLARHASEPGDVFDGAAQKMTRAAGTENAAIAMDEIADAVEYEMDEVGGVATGVVAAEEAMAERMLIRTASLTIGTQSYDASLNALHGMCSAAGGWTASASESTGNNGLRTCYLTLRVPADRLDELLSGSAALGRIIRRHETADDVTESYRDTQGRLATQQALMARLKALATDAASLTELLELEVKMADTQYQIDRLQSSLNTTEQKVNYATVDITLREESAASDITDGEKTFGERIVGALAAGGKAFVDVVVNGAIFLAAALPFIVVVVAAWLAVRAIRKKIRNKKER